ncbi:YkuS family protein [Sporosarcina trichiuri]|uniref:YkuS family protein n=1 Tax=Sporosarcina trichiuri TaxID=3056445 RepID=UPI0025B35084|nr:YkuS family protein [Sporosarcina sp. 0.2-SM1T-5]WJY27367.1 YkuS family protein [Sporosarcina sp. 0.2-SM1T-5]
MAKIAVEKPFDDVKKALEEKGHTVTMCESDEKLSGYDLGVVRALSDVNVDQYDFPVISIEGNSVDDIVADAEKRLAR